MSQPTAPADAGWLWKRSRRLRAWRRRYAVLHPDGRFNFYRREPSGSDAGDLRANFALSSEWECARAPEAHKLLFSFLMTIKIMMGDDRVDALEWRFCISGQTIKPLSMENPASDWIEANTWSVTQSRK